MQNVAPTRKLSRRSRDFLIAAAVVFLLGITLAIIGIALHIINFVVPSNPGFEVYDLTRKGVISAGVGFMTIAGRGYYSRQEVWDMVTIAKDAAEARQFLAGLAFDLLVLDVMMPGESGLDLAASLRETSNVPILMLTARGEAEDRIAGLERGVDDYLPKPFEPRELLLRIGSIMGRPARFRWIELGPGRGNLMQDALRATGQDPQFTAAAKICLVEKNEHLQARQAEALNRFDNIQWYSGLNEIPDDPSIVIANEFFDCLPIDQFIFRNQA